VRCCRRLPRRKQRLRGGATFERAVRRATRMLTQSISDGSIVTNNRSREPWYTKLSPDRTRLVAAKVAEKPLPSKLLNSNCKNVCQRR
jgi:hypothetical protein